MPRSVDDVYEELLAVRARQNDLNAWNDLVERFSPRLTYYVNGFVGDPDEAGSLMQDVWLRAFRGIRSLHDERRLAAWLYTIAHRVVMTHFRDAYARQEQTGEESLASVTTDDSCDLDRFDNAELVHHALARIGWSEREVLTLQFLENLSVADIAEVVGVPVGTVKSRLHRGRAELRAVIEGETEPTGGEG